MENIYLFGLFVSIIYFICKFIELRFITKKPVALKDLIINCFLIYFSIITSNFIFQEFNFTNKSLNADPPVFVDGPAF